MKRIVLAAVLSLLSIHAFSQQGKYGLEAGMGYTTFNKSYFTGAMQGYWLGRLSHTFYFGGALSFQRYSMLYTSSPSLASVAAGDILSVRQKSGYIFFTPKIEMGIGRTKHLFANLSFGPGIYLGGNQWTHQYQPFISSGSLIVPDTAFTNTSYNVPNLVFRFTGGFKQRFTTYGYWNIVVSEDVSYLPGKLNKLGPDMKANYFCITVGVMHKYPSVAMEED